MHNPILLLTLAAPVLLAAVAVLSHFETRPRPRRILAASRIATVATCLSALGSALYVATYGAASSQLLGIDPIGFSIRLDAMSVVLFGLVAFVGAVVVQFSRNYLDGNPRQGLFLGRLCLTLCAVCLLVLSGSLFQMVVAWIGTSMALHRLLLFYADRPRAIATARKKFICARIGDACLVLAALLLYRLFGTGDIAPILSMAREMAASGDSPIAVQGAALFIALGAVFKSAQFPAHGWLVEVMETPTPVSALLHAGIVNAGGFLAIRLSDVLVLSASAMHLLVIIGGATALIGTAVMLTQTNIKSALAWSTLSQMGFMLLQCGLGAFAAATLHIVAHSLYKAHAFLSSGSTVEMARNVPGPVAIQRPRVTSLLTAIAGSLLILVAMGNLWGVTPEKEPAIVALGAILLMGLSQLFLRGLNGGHGLRLVLRFSLSVAGLAFVYFGLQHGAAQLMHGLVPEAVAPDTATKVFAVLLVVLFGGVSLIQYYGLIWTARWPSAYVHLSNGLYANALFDRMTGSLPGAVPEQK